MFWERIIQACFFLSKITRFCFLFVFSQGISNLQSSINCDEGLGVASLATIYGTLIFSAIFVPSFVIRHLGLKWTLVASMSCYTLYMVANFYPDWYTLIPASVLVGLGAAPLWSAKCTYLTTIGRFVIVHVKHLVTLCYREFVSKVGRVHKESNC